MNTMMFHTIPLNITCQPNFHIVSSPHWLALNQDKDHQEYWRTEEEYIASVDAGTAICSGECDVIQTAMELNAGKMVQQDSSTPHAEVYNELGMVIASKTNWTMTCL